MTMLDRMRRHRNWLKWSLALVVLTFIIFYALFAMAIAEGRITEAPKLVQTVAYIVLGLIWVVPILPLIRWMAKPDKS